MAGTNACREARGVGSIGVKASPSQGVSYYQRDGYYAKDDPAHLAASAWAGKGAEEMFRRRDSSQRLLTDRSVTGEFPDLLRRLGLRLGIAAVGRDLLPGPRAASSSEGREWPHSDRCLRMARPRRSVHSASPLR